MLVAIATVSQRTGAEWEMAADSRGQEPMPGAPLDLR
jgi:hypothetical protein